MAQRKNPQLDALHQSILRKMQQMPENRICADCKAPSPRWASTNLGIFICIACSGIHRKLGTHISQVRSTTLDTWTPAQIARFQKLGNAKAAAYFEACIPEGFSRPSSSDSMAMEKFIRDKYERKRYITVENGGLGGASNERELARANSSFKNFDLRNTTATLGPRPSQPASNYDDNRPRFRKSAPLSYADTFRSPAITRNSPYTVTRTHMSTTSKPFNSAQTSLSKPGNAIQRATTVREIINMGFPADLAAKAAQVTEGDLQRAVNWILANSPATDQPPKAKVQPPPKAQVEPLMDLLDFGDPSPASKTNGVPGAMASELLLRPQTTAKPVEDALDDFTDFADFGAFESALPEVGGNSSTNRPAPRKNPDSLSGSITGLYAKGVGNVSASSVAQQQNIRNQRAQTMPTAVSRTSGLPGSPQWAPRSSVTGMSQLGGKQPLGSQVGNAMAAQSNYPAVSPRHTPLSRPPAVQIQSGFLQKSPGRLESSPGSTKTAGSTGSPSGMHQHLTWNGTNASSSIPGQDFSKLTGAGVAQPGLSAQATRHATRHAPNHKSEINSPDAIPSFTWPTSSKSEASGKAANSASTPTSNLGPTTSLSPTAGSLVPPPPPPPAEIPLAGEEGVPPPPDSPPPSHSNHNSESPRLDAVEPPEKTSNADGETTNGDSAAGTGSQEVEEEDPFAALSMLALSSATSKQKARQGKLPESKKAVRTSDTSSVPVATESSGIDLDNLFG